MTYDRKQADLLLAHDARKVWVTPAILEASMGQDTEGGVAGTSDATAGLS